MFRAGLPDFSWHNIPKRLKIYQIATKIPNDHNIFPMAREYIYQLFPFQGPPKFTQFGIFGLKIYIPSGISGSVVGSHIFFKAGSLRIF
jgi:hypothetical protein